MSLVDDGELTTDDPLNGLYDTIATPTGQLRRVEGAITAMLGDTALNDVAKTMIMPNPWPSVLRNKLC